VTITADRIRKGMVISAPQTGGERITVRKVWWLPIPGCYQIEDVDGLTYMLGAEVETHFWTGEVRATATVDLTYEVDEEWEADDEMGALAQVEQSFWESVLDGGGNNHLLDGVTFEVVRAYEEDQ
jgi:hypothetical protein